MQNQIRRQSRQRRNQQKQRSRRLIGGIPLFSNDTTPKVVCKEDEFLHKGACVKSCPVGYHGDKDCTPYECISGAPDGFLNSKRSATCRKAREVKAAFLKKRYDISKKYVDAYEAAMPKSGASPTGAALAKLDNLDAEMDKTSAQQSNALVALSKQ